MTVAAVILAPDPVGALADVGGEPALRRAIRSAWAGGALPVVAVMPESAAVAAAVADLPVSLVAPLGEPGIAWFLQGARASTSAVAEVEAALLWPFRYAWVDPETVTSLIEAFGAFPGRVLRPSFQGQPGFPILLSTSFEPRLAAMTGLHGEEAVARLISEGVDQHILELGDPGIVHDISTPRDALPAYQGPPGPTGGPPPEWNAAVSAHAESQASEDPVGSE